MNITTIEYRNSKPKIESAWVSLPVLLRFILFSESKSILYFRILIGGENPDSTSNISRSYLTEYSRYSG
jgi:hypothetical protein